ncbi:MAG: hypothetical protein AB7S38_11660 [Vulcanimicrobiota bacterium]
MRQVKFSLTDEQVAFLDEHESMGYKDRSALLREALERFRREALRERLERSGDLYAELYDRDSEGQAWVAEATDHWPD